MNNNFNAMIDEQANPIIVQQYTIICLFFLFLASTQRGCMRNPYTIVSEVFDWFKFEESLDKDLFYNIHRIDKVSFCKLVWDILPNLRKKIQKI